MSLLFSLQKHLFEQLMSVMDQLHFDNTRLSAANTRYPTGGKYCASHHRHIRGDEISFTPLCNLSVYNSTLNGKDEVL